MDKATEQALKTWYEPSHPLHHGPLHPALGLAGEAGELLDLYKKERFKDGFSWWDCIHCKRTKEVHKTFPNCLNYTPKILDELGDLWYYLRVLSYILKKELNFTSEHYYGTLEIEQVLTSLNLVTAQFAYDLTINKFADTGRLNIAYTCLDKLLVQFDYTLDQLTELNWQKLKDGDNHGWAIARKSL
jgi:NTP pyrophosphatase (non-canonical NTP hydrolase)